MYVKEVNKEIKSRKDTTWKYFAFKAIYDYLCTSIYMIQLRKNTFISPLGKYMYKRAAIIFIISSAVHTS